MDCWRSGRTTARPKATTLQAGPELTDPLFFWTNTLSKFRPVLPTRMNPNGREFKPPLRAQSKTSSAAWNLWFPFRVFRVFRGPSPT